MIVHLSAEEEKHIRRQLLSDIVYAITHDALKPMCPEHTELSPIEIYLSAQKFAEIISHLSDVDEGLEEEIEDLCKETKDDDEAMFILVVAAIMLQAVDQKKPTPQTHNTIIKIFEHCQDNKLFEPLLNQFANKEVSRIAVGKISNLMEYELVEIQRNNEDVESVRAVINGLILNAEKMDTETIRGLVISLSKFNLDNNHVIDEELVRLYEKLDFKSTNIAELKEFIPSLSRYPREKDYKGVVIWLQQQKKKKIDYYAANGYNRTKMCEQLSKLFEWDVKENSLRKAQEEMEK